MKKRLLAIVAAFLVASAVQAADDYAPGEVLVKFRTGGASLMGAGIPAASVKRFGAGRATVQAAAFTDQMQKWARVKLPAGMTVEQAIASLRNNPAVEEVTPNPLVRALLTPNDTQFPGHWNLHNTGQNILGVDGTVDADIDAPEAWDIETGASNQVIVAVVDSGVDYNHADLAANMWVNPGEIAGNGLDDDGNDIIDDVHGANFIIHDTTTFQRGNPMDDYMHGTHVAGIIGAATNNNIGVAGICWNVKIMAVKFLDQDGLGTVADGVEAINYAVSKGAKVINNSWGAGLGTNALRDAVAAAHAAGIVVTAAAGNDNSNKSAVYYPAAYPNVIAVSATNNTDALLLKNYGPHIELGAPGKDVISTYPNNMYARLTGSSMATPHVSGAAALLKAHAPSLTPDEIENLLKNSVDVPAGWDDRYGNGRLNVYNALRAIGDTTPPTVTLTAPVNNDFADGTIQLAATAADNIAVNRVVFFVDGVSKSTATAVPYTKNLNTTTIADGFHTITAVALDGAGNSASSSVTVKVINGDVIPPTITITSHADGDTVSGIISLASDATDDNMVDRVTFLVDGVLISSDTTAPYAATLDTLPLANGSHVITSRAFDLVDNASATTITVNVQNSDLIPPAVSITAPADGATVGGTIQLKATATDNLTVAKVWFLVDGVVRSTDTTSPYAANFNTALVADGTRTFTARAFDGVGNSADSSVSATVLNNDTIAPVVSIADPLHNATVSGTIPITATATDNVGIDRVRFFVDGVFVLGDNVPPYSITYNTGLIPDGPHTIMARAFDINDHNSSTHTITVIVQNTDTVPPAVNITAPYEGAIISGTVDLQAAATDNFAVAKIIFYVDGVARSTDTAAPFAYSFNALLETEGPHTLAARAFDGAGNNAQHLINVVISHTPTDFETPEVAFVAPTAGERVAGLIDVLATATDDNQVERVELWVDGTQVSTDFAEPWAYIWDADAAGAGPHTLLLKAIDPDDNIGTATIAVVVGNPAQALGLFQPLFNPARGETVTIPLGLGKTSHVKARILDRNGAELVVLADTDLSPGDSLVWDGRNDARSLAASGTYLLLIEIDGSIQTRKLIVRK